LGVVVLKSWGWTLLVVFFAGDKDTAPSVGRRSIKDEDTMKDFHCDNGGEFLNWALHAYLTGRPQKLSWTRSRAFRKNDNAH
jgi:hypothetical protein